jgi:peptidoglycan hydrolase CwlO-like protein
MADLYGALLAAAEEAGRMQADIEETQAEVKDLRVHVYELRTENEKLKNKLKDSGEILVQLINTLMSD